MAMTAPPREDGETRLSAGVSLGGCPPDPTWPAATGGTGPVRGAGAGWVLYVRKNTRPSASLTGKF